MHVKKVLNERKSPVIFKNYTLDRGNSQKTVLRKILRKVLSKILRACEKSFNMVLQDKTLPAFIIEKAFSLKVV